MTTTQVDPAPAGPTPDPDGGNRPSPVFDLPIADARPAALNDVVYKPVDPGDPAVRQLASNILAVGQLEPIVVTEDNIILSGHRRRVACQLAGLQTVKARRLPVRSTDPRFPALLVAFNLQREKSADEVFREELVKLDPRAARRRLVEHRQRTAGVRVQTIALAGYKRRADISPAKQPFLDAIGRVLEDRRDFWPLSDRAVHYGLLNHPPLIHAGKPGSRYRNDLRSYKSLCELLTRARLAGLVPFEAIHDPTRPVATWDVFPGVREFVRRELDGFLEGYWRDLQRPQPLHLEVVAEKNTLEGVVRPVASEFVIPYTIGRGYASLPPRYDMARRFRGSGKDRLLILFLSDFDPEGEDIAHSFARSMRDDFGVADVAAVKVALTAGQVRALGLPPQMKAKAGSSRRKGFVGRHGDDVFELEAVPPDRLQQILRDAIHQVIDLDLFHAEERAEADDAARLEAIRGELVRHFRQHPGLVGDPG